MALLPVGPGQESKVLLQHPASTCLWLNRLLVPPMAKICLPEVKPMCFVRSDFWCTYCDQEQMMKKEV